MLVKPLVIAESIKAALEAGNILNLSENPPVAVNGAAAFTYAAADIVKGDLAISGGAAVAGTLPTAEQLINALRGSLNIPSPPGNALYGVLPTQAVVTQWPGNALPIDPQSSFRRSFLNSNSNTVTQTPPVNAGVTVVGTATIATVTWREYLIRIMNSSPSAILAFDTVNTSKVLTLYPTNANRELLAQITPGMSVYGTGIGASAKVDSVNIDTGKVTVDVASTADGSNIAVTFTPTVIYQNIRAGAV